MNEVLEHLKQDITVIEAKVTELTTMASSANDPELAQMVKEEISHLKDQKKALEESISAILNQGTSSNTGEGSGHGEIDQNLAILEVRARTGGDEAGLFAGELFMMYSHYAEKQGWKVSEIARTEGGVPGEIRSISAEFKGLNVYLLLKNESGVHRVQRIPVTEAGGRIHTSTATVAVLPVVSPVEVEINPKDLLIDYYHSSGHGGQNVNKVETAVRIKHVPTGLVVESQEQRTQGQNKEKGMQVLRSRLFEMMQQQQKSKVDELRADQVGSGDRSEKIRTYNFPQDRITDHRVKESWHNIPTILSGEIEDILDKCKNIGLTSEPTQPSDLTDN